MAPVHGRKCAKGASLHRNCISMPEWRLWGLFFAGRDFAMKSMLPLIRQNVFLVVSHSPFLELLTLQKGPVAPFSATTPLFGRNGRFGGARRRCACSSPAACLTLRYVPLVICRSLPISQFCQSSSAVCRLAPGACHSVAAAVCPWPLGSVARCSPLPPLALAPFRPRSAFRRLLRTFAIPPIAAC